MKTIYLSGAITGTDDYEQRFNKAVEELRNKYTVLSPLTLCEALESNIEEMYCRKPTWSEYMRECLSSMLEMCKTIYMLKGWEQSKGAVIEHNLAKDLGYEIIYEEK